MPFQQITFNLKAPKLRREKMGGRNYLVAPMAMLTEGVHEGNGGPIFYPKEEFSKSESLWNSKPIVVYHPPVKNGVGISACDPVVISNQGVGLVLNTKGDDKLRAEAWVEEDRADTVDKRVKDFLENEKQMEISTGLWMDIERGEGEFNGKKYIGIARNFRPDHLALLPDRIGACSIADGGGLFQLNEVNSKLLLNHAKSLELGLVSTILGHGGIKNFLHNELSHSNIYSAVSGALRESLGDDYGWIEDVFDAYVVYWDSGKLMRQKYLATESSVTLVELPEQVTRVVEYRLVGAPTTNENPKEGDEMAKKDIVDGLIANAATQWKEDDRTFLMGLNEDQLKKFDPIVEKKKEEVPPTPTPAPTQNTQQVPPVTAPVQNKEETLEEALAKMPPQLRGLMTNALSVQKAEKDRLIGVITTNKRNPFSKEYLETLEVPQLSGMAQLAAGDEQQAQQSPPMFNSYFGSQPAASVLNQSQEPTFEALSLPVMNWSPDKPEAKQTKQGSAA